MKDQGYFSWVVCTGYFGHQPPVSGEKNVLLYLVQGRHLPHGKHYGLLLGRKGDVREAFLHLLFLRCLQLKIIHMPKGHTWGWHVLSTLSLENPHCSIYSINKCIYSVLDSQ